MTHLPNRHIVIIFIKKDDKIVIGMKDDDTENKVRILGGVIPRGCTISNHDNFIDFIIKSVFNDVGLHITDIKWRGLEGCIDKFIPIDGEGLTEDELRAKYKGNVYHVVTAKYACHDSDAKTELRLDFISKDELMEFVHPGREIMRNAIMND